MIEEKYSLACRLCGGPADTVFVHRLLAHNTVRYQLCRLCGYMQTEHPYWLDEANANPITLQDTGMLRRNIALSKWTALTLERLRLSNGRFLDFAGGYGIMTRLMRDIGYDFYWNDPYTSNLFARGFESDLEGRFDAITAFEVVEHLPRPISVFEELFRHTDTVILRTELRPSDVPSTDWMYYGLDHGQHVGFFNKHSLEFVAKTFNAHLLTDGKQFHVLTRLQRHSRHLPRGSGVFSMIRFLAIRHRRHSKTQTDSVSFNA